MKLTKCAIILLGSLTIVSNALAWHQFKQQHGKTYESQVEEAMRMSIFFANKQLVESHNVQANVSFSMALNHMADWTDEEFGESHLLKGDGDESDQLDYVSHEFVQHFLASEKDDPLPDEFDWRQTEDRVSAVKDQGKCGACWAFTTAGLLEGQELKRGFKTLVPLSAQQLVDCARARNKGCGGGFMSYALDDLAENLGGIESEEDYKYEEAQGECRNNSAKYLLSVKGHKMLPAGDEETLKKVLVKCGPIAAALETTMHFRFYEGGVFVDRFCKSKRPNHAVLIVGYGKDSEEGDFWIVKNSRGEKWGESGYMRILRGKNMCGIADIPTLAVL